MSSALYWMWLLGMGTGFNDRDVAGALVRQEALRIARASMPPAAAASSAGVPTVPVAHAAENSLVKRGSLFYKIAFGTNLDNPQDVNELQNQLADFSYGVIRKTAAKFWRDAFPYVVGVGVACVALYCLHHVIVHYRNKKTLCDADKYRRAQEAQRSWRRDIVRKSRSAQDLRTVSPLDALTDSKPTGTDWCTIL